MAFVTSAALFGADPKPAAPQGTDAPATDEEAPKPRPKARRNVSPASAEVDLLAPEGPQLRHWRLTVELDGQPISTRWDAAFARLTALVDRDANGGIDRQEAALLPGAFALRQLLWGRFLGSHSPPAFDDLDLDGNGQASGAEIADYYRHYGLGSLTIGVGLPPNTRQLTKALVEQLQLTKGSLQDDALWKTGVATVRALDRDADELISPHELIGRTAYPGAWASILLQPPGEERTEQPSLAAGPFMVLPQRTADTHWASVILDELDQNDDGQLAANEARLAKETFAALDRDRDERLTSQELAAWREQLPDLKITLRLDSKTGLTPERAIVTDPAAAGDWNPIPQVCLLDRPGYTLQIRNEASKLWERWEAQTKTWDQEFTQLDAENARKLPLDRLTALPQPPDQLRQLYVADLNQDQVLAREEVAAWLEVHALFVRCQTLLSVLDYGPGLFELLDADHDGSLSVPELSAARERLRALAGGDGPATWRPERLPRQVRWTVSLGRPESLLRARSTRGPAWFVAMDRNGDGRLTQAEFAGGVEDFRKLDQDANGVVSIEEATAK